MTKEYLKTFDFGNIIAVFYTVKDVTSFTIVPRGFEDKINDFKMRGINPFNEEKPEPCVQIAIEGDSFSRDFSAGQTHKNTDTAYSFRLVEQNEEFNGEYHILTSLFRGNKGLEVKQFLSKHNKYDTLEMHQEITNTGDENVMLEMASSFTLNRLSPFRKYDDPSKMVIHTMENFWSAEGKLISETADKLILDSSWSGMGIRQKKLLQVGSMPAKNSLPFVAVEDLESSVVWAVQIEAPSSWQIEITHRHNGIHLCGGQADYTSGHWKKKLKVGECFTTKKAFMTVVNGKLLDATDNLVNYFNTRLKINESEKNLPIIYNEYCYSWGTPTMDKLKPLISFCGELSIPYFIMDAGWYRDDSKGDWFAIGDWKVNKECFPQGLKEYGDLVADKKMRAGIWFEFENVSDCSDLALTHPEYLLAYCGKVINHQNRSFLDFRKPEVLEYCREKVIKQLKDNNIGYIKIDYNENIGIGVDGDDSLGEGLRKHIACVLNFLDELRKELPDLIIEICSSGGMRHEPLFISKGNMVSFSDAHECPSGAVIASNLHRYMLPRQMQIWATIRDDYDEQDTYFTIAKAMLGRYCLSGNIASKTESIKDIIRKSIKFYEHLKPIIIDGKTILINDDEIKSYFNTKGAHYLVRESRDKNLVAVYLFSIDEPEREFNIPISGDYEIDKVFNNSGVVDLKDGNLYIKTLPARMWGTCIILKKKN